MQRLDPLQRLEPLQRFDPFRKEALTSVHLDDGCQKHPTIGLVAATCSYVPSFFPIWGNHKTFSWEPFLERTVARNQTLSWSVDYEF